MFDPFLDASLFRSDLELQREGILSEELNMHLDGTHSSMGTNFRGCGPLIINFDPFRKNYSEYNRFDLLLTNQSQIPVRLHLKLFHAPVIHGETLPPLSVSGGTNIVLPNVETRLTFLVGDFGTYGGPKQFQEIHRFQLHVDFPPWESSRGDVNVDIKTFEGIRTATVAGPRLTGSGLSHVMPYHGELTEGMRKPLIDPKGLEVPPPHSFPKESCASDLSGFVMGIHMTEIDWTADPFKALEWTHFLNRFHFTRGLVMEFLRSGNSAAAHRFVDLIRDWIIKNPVPLNSDGGAGPLWETLTAAWRLIEWLPAISGLWSHSALDKETKMLCLQSIWEHAQHLKSHQGHPNNWRIVESCALISAGIYFPEFEDSHSWIEVGSARLRAEIDRQYYPDGVQYEISPLYNAICLENLLRVFDGLNHVGKPAPDYLVKVIQNGTNYLTSLSRPNFTWPSVNDSSSSNQNYCALLAYSAGLISDPHAEWVGSRGARGLSPGRNVNVFPHSGLVIVREGWFPEANYMMFRAGPPGAFHIHQDNLSLEIFARGKLRFADPGISTYAPDAVSEFYRSACGHNMVVVQGHGPKRKRSYDVAQENTSGLHVTRHGNRTIMVSGSYSGEWGMEGLFFNHKRSIAFIDGCFWVMRDYLFGNDAAEISICWQCAPGRVEHDLDSWGFFFEDVQSSSIGIIPELGGLRPEIEVYTGCSRPPRGWISVNGSDVPATTIVYNFSAAKHLEAYWLILPVNGKFPARNTDNEITRKEGYAEVRLGSVTHRIDFENREISAVDE